MIREPGRVANVFSGREIDRNCLFVEVMIQLRAGDFQSFAVVPDDLSRKKEAINALCRLFKVTELEHLKGQPCVVLRSWPHEDEPIEGLEVGGERFTLSSFEGKPPAIERKRLEIESEIAWMKGRLDRLEDRLADLPKHYIDWESRP